MVFKQTAPVLEGRIGSSTYIMHLALCICLPRQYDQNLDSTRSSSSGVVIKLVRGVVKSKSVWEADGKKTSNSMYFVFNRRQELEIPQLLFSTQGSNLNQALVSIAKIGGDQRGSVFLDDDFRGPLAIAGQIDYFVPGTSRTSSILEDTLTVS